MTPLVARLLTRLEGQIWVAPDFDETEEEAVESFYDSQGL